MNHFYFLLIGCTMSVFFIDFCHWGLFSSLALSYFYTSSSISRMIYSWLSDTFNSFQAEIVCVLGFPTWSLTYCRHSEINTWSKHTKYILNWNWYYRFRLEGHNYWAIFICSYVFLSAVDVNAIIILLAFARRRKQQQKNVNRFRIDEH